MLQLVVDDLPLWSHRPWLFQSRRESELLAGCPPVRQGGAAPGRCLIDSWQVPLAAAAVTSDARDLLRRQCATPRTRPVYDKSPPKPYVSIVHFHS